MYKLLKPIHGGLGVLIQEVEGHIKQTGMEAVRSLKGDNVSQSGGPPPSLSLSQPTPQKYAGPAFKYMLEAWKCTTTLKRNMFCV